MGNRRTAWGLLVLLIGGAAAGCGVSEQEAERLSLACQFSRCDCVSVAIFGGSEPVRWRDDGSAYCPDGYALRKLGDR
jgi:hypothetical protein